SGEPAIGIVSGDISIREQRRSRGVESVTPASESPLTVAIALDVSASMRDTLPDLQEAAIRFLDTLLTERDRAMVITFDTRARLLQPATSDRDLLRRTLLHLRPAGLTALYDAMILGLLQFEGVKGRRALVVFTDGVDRTSDHVAADLRDVARRSNVPIFVVTGVARHGNLSMPPPIRGRPLLKSAAVAESELWQELIRELGGVARSTGGQLFELKSLDRLGEIYDDIGRALGAQLLVTFRSDAGGENEWRAIDVSIPRRSLRVHAPSGYYAPR
ncbi:MAG TPA: VWA domain-containing protein, partial [Thermoanaerobaculia bacterium]